MRAKSEISDLKSQITRRVRWGVLGSGGIAHRRTIPEGIVPADNAELVAVFNPTQTTNEAVARDFGARPCTTIDDLLASAAEAIFSCWYPPRALLHKS